MAPLKRPCKRKATSSPPAERSSGKRLEIRAKIVYQTRTSPGKGLGLFAKCDIPRGYRIMSEMPMLALAAHEDQVHAYSLFRKLCESDQETYLQLSYAADEDKLESFANQLSNSTMSLDEYRDLDTNEGARVIAIWESNAFSLGKTGRFGSGIFDDATRINHSCQPNAAHTWNPHLERQVVHALRDIAKGEEITMTYVRPLQATSVRQAQLRETYGFVCNCASCDVNTPAGLESTFRRRQIQTFHEYLEDIHNDDADELIINTTEELLELMTLEGINSWDKGRRLSDLADAYERRKDYKKAAECEQQALDIALASFGEDDEVVKDVARNLKLLQGQAEEDAGYIS